MRPEGQTALVTGGAVRLGRSIALALADHGWDVIVHYGNSQREATDTASAVESVGQRAWAVQADLADPGAITRMIAEIEETVGSLDLVVNNAARFDEQPWHEVTSEDWDRSMAVNLRAPFLIAQQAQPMLQNGAPRDPSNTTSSVVNIADLSGVHPWLGYVQHGASKAGLIHLTRILARELAPHIRVNAIVPGAILPPPDVHDETAWRDRTSTRIPLERTGRPDDISRAVIFLAESGFISGAVVPIDGAEGLLGPVGH